MTTVVEALQQIQSEAIDDASPGAFKILEATLHHGQGKEYPIGNLISAINLFENIETVGVTGWLDMYDNVNLIQGGPIIGHELLYLKFETGGASAAGVNEFAIDYTTHPLFVHKVEQLESGSQDGKNVQWLSYRLHFCSTEMLRNDRIRLSRTYQGVVSDIVNDVLKNYLETTKPVEIVDTIEIQHLIAPNIRPFDLISDLTPQAQCVAQQKISQRRGGKSANSTMFKGAHSDFLFYETAIRSDDSGGFKFKPALSESDFPSLKFTLQQSPAAPSTNVPGTPIVPTDAGYPAVMLRSLNYEITNLGDKYNSIPTGAWAAKSIRHNGISKSYSTYESNYIESLKHKRFAYVSETPTYNSKRTISEWPDAYINFSSGSAKRESNINAVTKRVDYPWVIVDPAVSLNRKMQLRHILGMQRLELTLPGISGLSVGDLAFADLPEIGLAAGQPGLEGAKQLWENRFDNVWLVTKVAHSITTSGDNPQYLTKIELANTMSSTGQTLPSYHQLGRTAPPASIWT